MEETKKRGFWHPAFGAVIVYCTITFCNITMLTNPVSLFTVKMMEDWNAMSGTIQLRTTVTGIVSIITLTFARKLYAKYNYKVLAITGILCYAGAFFLYSFAPNVYVYIAIGAIQGVGQALASFTAGPMIVQNWFDKNLAVAVAIPMVFATGVSTITTPQISRLIGSLGWRPTLRIISIAGIVVAVLGILIFGNFSPEAVGKRPFGYVPTKDEQSSGSSGPRMVSGISIESLRKSGLLYVMVFMSFAATLGGRISMFIAQISADAGFSLEMAGNFSAAMSMGSTILLLVTPILCDWLGLKLYTYIMLPVNIIVQLLLANSGGNEVLMYVACFLLSVNGLQQFKNTAPKTLFGKLDLPAVVAAMAIGTNIATTTGTVLIGYIRDFFGSYSVAVYFLISCNVINLILIPYVFKKVKTLKWEERELPAAASK